MIAQRFPESNIAFTKPEGWTDEECHRVHGFTGNYADHKRTPVVITAWKPTPEELVKLNLGEPLWLTICAKQMVPVLLSTQNPWGGSEKPTDETQEDA